MRVRASFAIVGEPDASLLCRLIDHFSRQGLSAPDLVVRRDGNAMVVQLSSEELTAPMAQTLTHKIESLIGVHQVDLALQDAKPRCAARQ